MHPLIRLNLYIDIVADKKTTNTKNKNNFFTELRVNDYINDNTLSAIYLDSEAFIEDVAFLTETVHEYISEEQILSFLEYLANESQCDTDTFKDKVLTRLEETRQMAVELMEEAA